MAEESFNIDDSHRQSGVDPSSAYGTPSELSSTFSGALPVPPNDEFAEQAILGAIIVEDEQVDTVFAKLNANDFYAPRHRKIFEVMQNLYEEQKPINVVGIRSRMIETGDFEAFGGLAYLAKLADSTPYSAKIESHIEIVKERSVLRAMLKSAREIQEIVYSRGDQLVSDLLSVAQQKFIRLSNQFDRGTGLNPLGDAVEEVFSKIEEMYSNPSMDNFTGVPSGFADLDRKTFGFQGSDLIIIAGRPSMGKTALAMNIAEHVAIVRKKKVAVFSLEMSELQLARRCLSSVSGVAYDRIRTGNLGDGRDGDNFWELVAHALDVLSAASIYIDSTPGISPLDIIAKARRMHREQGLDLVIVDYLQLLQMKDNDSNRAIELANITRALKVLAQELDIPVIALSQLNRSVESRANKRPLMADLKDSGAIEQDADLIIFVYREEMYDEDTDDQNLAELIISKHRNGETGKVELFFMKECARFQNSAPSFMVEAI